MPSPLLYGWPETLRLILEEAAQLARTRRMLELPECFCLNLPNPLAGHAELLAHFL